MSRFLFSFALIVLSPFASVNFSVSESEAKKYANNFMSIYSKNELSESKKTHFIDSSIITFVSYIIIYCPEGSMLISSDKPIVPVLAFSKEGAFVNDGLENLPFYFWFERYEKEKEWTQSSKIIKSIPEWTSGRNPVKTIATEPLIKSKWNQNQGWKQFCPEDAAGLGGIVYAGCVAVDKGQAMLVNKHPSTLKI